MKRQVFSLLSFLFLSTMVFGQVMDIEKNSITTKIKFEESTYDFGTITSGDKASHVYTFINTGDKPLIIKDAKGSCGCTVPEWPKEPIMPGETGIIEVEFNSKGKTGQQSKRVTLTANTNPAQTFLTITGMVEKDETATDEKEEKYVFGSDEGKTTLEESNSTGQVNDSKQLKAKDCFAIFPNPTSDILKLELNEHQGEGANISIFNATGQKMAFQKVNEISEQLIEFDVIDYPTGTYYVNIQIGKEAPSTKCFVVANH